MITCKLEDFLKDLEELVNIESFSRDPEGTAQVAVVLRSKFEALGWHVTQHHISDEVGPMLVITNKPNPERYDVLMLGHMDTVFPRGTVAERPFTKDAEACYGPGVADMKDGDLAGYYVCKSLQDNGELDDMSICIAFNPDEEISSRFSRPYIEAEAKKADYCIILESARLNGNFVNERKGVAKYVIEFFGKSAHAAVAPEKGANALEQFIITAQEIMTWANPEVGSSVNIGTIKGGTTPNSIPDYVRIEVDVRLKTMADGERIDALMHDIPNHMTVKGVTAKVDGKIFRPPMNPSAKTLEWCKAIDEMCKEVGLENLEWEASAGGSDGNFTANLGVPTIDGLGPAGGNGHSVDEKLWIEPIMKYLEVLYKAVRYCKEHK